MKNTFILLCLISTSAYASFPKNNLEIPVDSLFRSSLTEEDFNRIIDRAEKVYAPIAKEKKAQLIISRGWKNNTVNASASRFGGSGWYVNMFGGMARHPLITDDAFLFVLCHEIGHHLGGAPKIGGLRSFWSSTEGEADYFAGMKCMRKILSDDDNPSLVKEMKVDPLLKERCSSIYHNENEVALCERIGMAGKSLGDLLVSLKPGSAAVSFATPDPVIARKTQKDHPNAQCRLDTFFSSVSCTKSFDEEMGKKDPTIGACTKRDGYELGMRPKCWYHPKRGEE